MGIYTYRRESVTGDIVHVCTYIPVEKGGKFGETIYSVYMCMLTIVYISLGNQVCFSTFKMLSNHIFRKPYHKQVNNNSITLSTHTLT